MKLEDQSMFQTVSRPLKATTTLYKVFSYPSTFEKAVKICKSWGGRLAQPSNAGDYAKLNEKISSKKPFWIGLKNLGQNWEWLDRGPLTSSIWNGQRYFNINNNRKVGECAVMYNKFASDTDCSEKHAIACEKEVNMFSEEVKYTSYKINGCQTWTASH